MRNLSCIDEGLIRATHALIMKTATQPLVLMFDSQVLDLTAGVCVCVCVR